MSKDIQKECKVVVNEVSPCTSLMRHDDDKAIRFRQIEHNGSIVKTFYTLHDKSVKYTGVVINHCPFCGVNIGSHVS